MLADLLCYCKHKPVFNEIELNPTLTQSELLGFMKTQGVIALAYCPVARLGAQADNLWNDKAFKAMCKKYSKTPA